MHYAKVNPTNLGGIVINEAHRFRVKLALNRKFLAYLTLHGILKRLQTEIKKRMVFIVDVAANADRPFCHQAFFAGILAANIMQDILPVGDHHVRNDLLEGWIDLGLGTGHETVVPGIKNGWQIAFHIGTETLKNAELIEN